MIRLRLRRWIRGGSKVAKASIFHHSAHRFQLLPKHFWVIQHLSQYWVVSAHLLHLRSDHGVVYVRTKLHGIVNHLVHELLYHRIRHDLLHCVIVWVASLPEEVTSRYAKLRLWRKCRCILRPGRLVGYPNKFHVGPWKRRLFFVLILYLRLFLLFRSLRLGRRQEPLCVFIFALAR